MRSGFTVRVAMDGKFNGFGTIKNETQLKVDSRKEKGCLIGPGVGGTVEQRRSVRCCSAIVLRCYIGYYFAAQQSVFQHTM